MFEITGEIPEPIIDELEEARSPGEHGTPSLEVRRCGDGHPPVTKREREIRLNGISGVTFQETRIEIFRSGFFHSSIGEQSGWAKKNFTFSLSTDLKMRR